MVEFFSSATWACVMWRLHVLPELLLSILSRYGVSLLQFGTQAEGKGRACTVSSKNSGSWRRRKIVCRNDRCGHFLAVLSSFRLLFADRLGEEFHRMKKWRRLDPAISK